MQIQELVFKGAQTSKPARVLCIDCIFYHYLSKELKLSTTYRLCFFKIQKNRNFRFILEQTRYDLIDYKWNERVTEMVQERCELDHALSWLSTLGGAFSALGDYFSNCALIAAKISVNQLKLALRLKDPTIASRCRLYFSLSLIQQGRFKLARYIISEEYRSAKEATVVDLRLLKMCEGIWAKLQYEHRTRRRKFKQITIK